MNPNVDIEKIWSTIGEIVLDVHNKIKKKIHFFKIN